jgi:hypothetical protein
LILLLSGHLDRVRLAQTLQPKGQRRYRASPSFPRRIDVALQAGAGLIDLNRQHRARDRALNPPPTTYDFPPSISASSKFYQVTAICARVASGRDQEPERSIRAYLKTLKIEPRVS